MCSVVGIACWFGRGPTVASADADGSNAGGVKEITTSTPASPVTDFLPETAPWLNLHLPSYTVPRHYDLTLYPDFYGSNEMFYGNVTIEIDIKQATWYLLVHIKELQVQGVGLFL